MHAGEINRDTQGTNGIPDTDKFDTYLPRETLTKELGLNGSRMRRIGAVAIELVGRIGRAGVLPLQHARVAQKACSAARCVRTAAGANNETRIVRIVVLLDEEHIGVLPVARQPRHRGSTT